MRKLYWAITFSTLCLRADFVLADEIVMKNGSRLIGTIVSASDGKIKFDTEFAGTISVNADSVETLFTDNEVTVILKDGRIIENQRIAAPDDGLVMLSENNEALLFQANDMKRLNPESWELGRGYNHFGNVSVAGLLERGNTDTDEFDISGESVWRSLRDRYTIKAKYELDRNDGVRNKNKWRWRNKYDRFSTKDSDNYRGMLLAFEGDEFADIDLRTTIGPYLGRQFYEGKLLSLSGEVGLVWVDEQFDPDQEDISLPDENDYAGANWAFHITSDYFGDASNFYINHDGILNLDETDDLLLNTTMGIKFDVWDGIEVGVEARYEYDGDVGEDIDELDETYKLRFGYKW